MLLDSTALNEINKIVLLKNEELVEKLDSINNEVMQLIDNSLFEIQATYSNKLKMRLETYGDYFVNTFNQQISPLTYVVLLKEDKGTAKSKIYYSNKKSLFKRNKLLTNSTVSIQPSNYELANLLTNSLNTKMGDSAKLFTKFGTIRITYKGFNIKIIVGYEYEKGECEFTDNSRTQTLYLDKAKKNLQTKMKQTNYTYCDICRLLKTFELEMLLANKTIRYFSLSTMFVETIIYNVPNEILKSEDIFDSYVKTMNYLELAKLSDFKYLDDSIIKDEVYLKNIRTFILKMKYFMLNAIEIIEKEVMLSQQDDIDDKTLKGKINKKVQDVIDN